MHDLDDHSPAAASRGRHGGAPERARCDEPRRRPGQRPAAPTAGRTTAAEPPGPPAARVAHRPLSPIALGRSRDDVLREALRFAREASGAHGAFAAVDGGRGAFPVDVRDGLDEPCWTGVAVRPGRGLGGRVLDDHRPRTSDDYARDGSITADYRPIMRRESVHATAVVPVEDLSGGAPAAGPAALLYVTSHDVGAPGDRVLHELLRIADMAAVGLAHLGAGAPPAPTPDAAAGADAGSATSLTPRELELLRLLATGCSNRELGDALVIAPSTVKAHLARIYRKLGASSRLGAVAAARRAGLV